MPFISLLQIHPIKALDPVVVREAHVLESGALEFDRRWALFDRDGRFINGKNRASIHSIRASYDLRLREVDLDGNAFSLNRQVPEIENWFSDRLGEKIELRENAELGFPDDTEANGPTFVTQATLTLVANWFNLALDETRVRFRTSVEIGGTDAFWEDGLYGSWFRAGSARVEAVNPCQRCVVPSRNPLTGAQDAGFQVRFTELRRTHFPAWGKAAPFNHYYRLAVNTRILSEGSPQQIHVGDAVEF